MKIRGREAAPTRSDIAARLRIQMLAVDLDGTLVDSAPDLAHCLGEAVGTVGLAPPGEARTRSWIGDGIDALISRALAGGGADDADAKLHAAVLDTFNACYRRNLFTRSRLYSSAAETLAVLGRRGIRLCCVTNKRLVFADALLRAAGIRTPFEFVIGGDSVAAKKPDPLPLTEAAARAGVEPARAAMVGDSHHDFHAAKAAGFRFIWAAYGYCAALDATPEDAVVTIERFSALPDVLAD
jgi:phosphoglycolate phosphatase